MLIKDLLQKGNKIMYQGQTMKLPSHNLKLDELIFNATYNNAKKVKEYNQQILESDVEKDEDAEMIKAKASKKTKEMVRDSIIKDDDQR